MRDPIVSTRSRATIAAETRAELNAWIDERVADLVTKGMPADAARERALQEFGDADAAERYARSQDVTADLWHRARLCVEELVSDTRIALRTLARTPIVTAVVFLTFSLGIGATTAVFSLVHAILIRRLPYGAEAGLVALPAVDNGVIRPGIAGGRHSATTLVALRERTTSFSGIAAIEAGSGILRGNGDGEQLFDAGVTPNTFEVLQAQAAIGRVFRESEGTGAASNGVMIITDGLWRRRFGADSGAVGRTIEFGNARRVIVGVMPPGFRVPMLEQTEVLTPLDVGALARNPIGAHTRAWRLFARMRHDVSVQGAQADVDREMHALQLEGMPSVVGVGTRVMPIRAAVAGETRPRILVLMGAALFVLLLACANVAGILLARAIARRRELAVRLAIGAGRGRLVRQFLAEGLVVAAFGAGLGLLVAQAGIAALRHIMTNALPPGTTFALELPVMAFAVGLATVAAITSSLVPAFGATGNVGNALRRDDGRSSVSHGGRALRLGLVAGQVAASVVLLVGAGLFTRSLIRLAELDLGYATEHVLTLRPRFLDRKSNAQQDVYYASVYEALRAVPGVVSVAGGNVPTTGDATVTTLEVEGRTVDASNLRNVRYTPVSDDYFAALTIPVVRGRTFTAVDRDSASWVAVVSAKLASQLWPGTDPIGARIRVEANKPWTTVIGVVGDVRMGGEGAAEPSVYTSQRQDHWAGPSWIIVRATEDPALLAASVLQAVKRLDPTLVVVGMRTLEDLRENTPAIAERRVQMQLMTAFALVALVVAAIGVYGVGAYTTESRRREFGIRMALGAPRRIVLFLALRDGALSAIVGAAVGTPLAWLLASRLGTMLYSVAPSDPLTTVAVLGALFAVVFAASLVPARRAAHIDPARTIRED